MYVWPCWTSCGLKGRRVSPRWLQYLTSSNSKLYGKCVIEINMEIWTSCNLPNETMDSSRHQLRCRSLVFDMYRLPDTNCDIILSCVTCIVNMLYINHNSRCCKQLMVQMFARVVCIAHHWGGALSQWFPCRGKFEFVAEVDTSLEKRKEKTHKKDTQRKNSRR